MRFCLYLFLFLFYFLLSFSFSSLDLSLSFFASILSFSSFFLLLFLLSPPILLLSLLELSLSLDFAQTQTHMPQAPFSNQWVSLFGSIRCFSLSLAQIDAPSMGSICLGLLVLIDGCEAVVVGWRVGLLLEWVCFGVLVGMVEAVFLFDCGFVNCWLLVLFNFVGILLMIVLI